MIKSAYDFNLCISSLSPEQITIVCEAVKDKLLAWREEIKTTPSLNKYAQYINAAINKQLIEDLSTYIKNIEDNKPATLDSFRYSLWVSKHSIALTQKINHKLALKLRDELSKENADVENIFKQVETLRNNIITDSELNTQTDFTDQGIQSDELADIIRKGLN